MSERMRSNDWSNSPLGTPEAWSQSLRTALRILLTSRFPMVIWWGAERALLYNDGWISILGNNKHPKALGRPGREIWPEIWNVIGPMFDGVFNTKQATWSDDGLLLVNRHHFIEEAYFTWSYSPILEESGDVGGVFTAVTETTERVIGERQMKTLRDLAARSLEVREVEAACRIAAETLGANPYDIPFSLLYLIDQEKNQAQLVASSGLEADTPINKAVIDLTDEAEKTGGWMIGHFAQTSRPALVEALDQRFDYVPEGPWKQRPQSAMVIPVMLPGHDLPTLLLILGISTHLAFDDLYRNFFSLIAGQISSTLADALAYQEERRRAEMLAELDHAKTLFFSNVSHEFRTPLTLMLGPLEDLLAKASGGSEYGRDQLNLIHRNGLRLLKLVNTLLDFSRIEAGRIQASYEATDLAALTTDLTSAFRSVLERAGLHFVIDLQPLPEPVYVDRDMWEKIVFNLLSNAFKFTMEGQIEVRLQQVGNAVELTVRDTGIGIPPEEIPHLFARFHRVQGAHGRTFEGSGIGLALVQELVKQHHGRVSVESSYGQGSTFCVSLPLGYGHLPADRIKARRNEAATALKANVYVEEALRWLPEDDSLGTTISEAYMGTEVSGREPETGQAHSLERAHILLADDNADMREYVSRLLGAQYEVEAVGDGQAALEAARASLPDLVLSDVMMPVMDGFSLLRELRADPHTSAVPVILLSARAGEESQIEGLEAGADDYLIKPFSARELLARVKTHLEMARVRREAQERIIGIWESLTDGFVTLDSDWRYIYINAAAERMGLKRAELLGKTIWEAFPDVIGTDIEKEFRRAVAQQQTVEFEAFYPAWNLWFNSKVFPAADGSLAVYIRDVGDRKRAELEREQLLEREQAERQKAEEASRLKDEFLATISHELRTPLNAILGWSQMLQAGRPVDQKTALQGLRAIYRNAKNQAQLIEDLLDVSRIVSGKLRLEAAPIYLAEVIHAAVDSLRPALDAKGIHLHTIMSSDVGGILGDANRLQQIIWNLLSNAVKFTPEGGDITIRQERRNSHALISVSDTGKGIHPEFLPFVFERFRQADSSSTRAYGGLGLGLAIVRHLVELHGGTIEAQSAGEGCGATFIVRLPIVAPAAVAPFPNSESLIQMSDSTSYPCPPEIDGLRLLLVDDEPDTLQVIQTVLEQCGAQVKSCDTAEKAYQAVLDWQPDLLVSDIAMPGEDGYSLIKRIRALGADHSGNLLAIALTAYVRVEDRTRVLTSGFQMYVPKPVEPSELLAVIGSVVKAHRITLGGSA